MGWAVSDVSRRLGLLACALALGATGSALLGGCGGGTRTVSVSSGPPAATAGAATAAHTTAASPSASGRATRSNTQTIDGTVTQGEPSQSAGTPRTAPAPAFLHGGTSNDPAAGAAASQATSVVRERGYTPVDPSTYHATQTLRVLIGTRGSTAGDQRAFFFLDGRYIGTDASQPSASLRVVSQNDTEVALAYALYRPHDPLCCPSGGQAVVHFQLNNGQLAPSQPIPPASSATGLARQ